MGDGEIRGNEIEDRRGPRSRAGGSRRSDGGIASGPCKLCHQPFLVMAVDNNNNKDVRRLVLVFIKEPSRQLSTHDSQHDRRTKAQNKRSIL